MSNFGMTHEAFVDRTTTTSEEREYRSMTNNKKSPDGNGP